MSYTIDIHNKDDQIMSAYVQLISMTQKLRVHADLNALFQAVVFFFFNNS